MKREKDSQERYGLMEAATTEKMINKGHLLVFFKCF